MKKAIALTMSVLIMTSLLAGCVERDQVPSSTEPAAIEDSPSSVAEEVKKEMPLEESDLEPESVEEPTVVFFTTDITAEGLVRVYERLDWRPTGNVAVKISTGEPPASNY